MNRDLSHTEFVEAVLWCAFGLVLFAVVALAVICVRERWCGRREEPDEPWPGSVGSFRTDAEWDLEDKP